MVHDDEKAIADHHSAQGALGQQADTNRTQADTDHSDAADTAAANRTQADTDHTDTTDAAATNREQADTDHTDTTEAAAANRKQADDDQVALLERIDQRSYELTAAVLARNAKDDRDRRRFAILLGVAFATIALIGLVAVGYLRGQTSRDERTEARAAEQRASVVAAQKQIADCVTPTSKCYRDEEMRRATLVAGAVAATAQANVAASSAATACAQTNQGYVAIKACVDRALAGK